MGCAFNYYLHPIILTVGKNRSGSNGHTRLSICIDLHFAIKTTTNKWKGWGKSRNDLNQLWKVLNDAMRLVLTPILSPIGITPMKLWIIWIKNASFNQKDSDFRLKPNTFTSRGVKIHTLPSSLCQESSFCGWDFFLFPHNY